MSLVAFAKIKEKNIKKAIDESLNLLSYCFDKNLQKVVIKINACYYWDYSTGKTTDPQFVAGLIDLLRERTSNKVDIALVESDASAMKCKYAYKFLGYEKLSKEYGVRLINLSNEKAENVTVKSNGQTRQFLVPNIIRDADLRINVPKIKYSVRKIELTCALKNIYGCNPYPLKFKYHPELADVIVALNKAMSFDLHIIDGNIVSGIAPRRLGLVMASTDPVAIDVVSAKIAGLNPNRIEYLQLAAKEGLGSLTCCAKGESVDQYRALYPKKTLKTKLKGLANAGIVRLGLAKRLGF